MLLEELSLSSCQSASSHAHGDETHSITSSALYLSLRWLSDLPDLPELYSYPPLLPALPPLLLLLLFPDFPEDEDDDKPNQCISSGDDQLGGDHLSILWRLFLEGLLQLGALQRYGVFQEFKIEDRE